MSRGGDQQGAGVRRLPAGGLRLRAAGTPSSLPGIRSAVVDAAERCGFGDEDVAKIEMAVGEACSNVIEHAYLTHSLCQDIEICMHQYDDRLEITILDYSTVNFPVDEAPAVDPQEYIGMERRRGLGLYIIRSFVDHLEHRFIGGQGNELRLVKYLA